MNGAGTAEQEARFEALLHRIYPLQDEATLVATLCTDLPALLPCDNVFVGRHDMRRTRLDAVVVREPLTAPDFVLQVNDHAGEHPLWEPIQRGPQVVRTLSDHASRRRWHETGLYRELLRHDDVQDHASVEFGDRSGALTSIGLFRSQRGFATRERQLLGRLIPHLDLALRNARSFERLRDARSTGPEGLRLLQLTPEGAFPELSPAGRRRLANLFGPLGLELPAPLARWLEVSVAALNRGQLEATVAPLRTARDGISAEFRLRRRADGPGYWLLLRTRRRGPEPVDRDPEALLTARETDVLTALQRGCTNEEIALTLGISFFTVKTHLKSIYRKLGVRSRTEASLARSRPGETPDTN